MREIFDIIFGAGAIQGLFLSFMLFRHKKGNHKANRILALLLLIFSISLLHSLLVLMISADHLEAPLLVREPFQFLFGPLILFYGRQLTGSVPLFRKMDLLHFLPFFLITATIIIPLNFHPMSFAADKFLSIAIWICLIFQLSVYASLIKRRIGLHEGRIKSDYSTIDTINLQWLKLFAYGLVALHVFYLFLLPLLVHNAPYPLFTRIVALTLSLLIYGLGYRGFSQPEIFSSSAPEEKSNRYERSGLTDREKQKIKDTLLAYMEKEKPFLDPDLTLPLLAEQTGMGRNRLSQVINESLDRNFYDFINEYRIEAVKKAMENGEDRTITILGLAMNAGFKSKATFNAVFKKTVGETPSQYMRRVRDMI